MAEKPDTGEEEMMNNNEMEVSIDQFGKEPDDEKVRQVMIKRLDEENILG